MILRSSFPFTLKIQSDKSSQVTEISVKFEWEINSFGLALMLRHAWNIKYFPRNRRNSRRNSWNREFYGTSLVHISMNIRSISKRISRCTISIAFHNTIKNQYKFILVCVSTSSIIYIDINRFQIHIISMDSFSFASDGRQGRLLFYRTFTFNTSMRR